MFLITFKDIINKHITEEGRIRNRIEVKIMDLAKSLNPTEAKALVVEYNQYLAESPLIFASK
jgi:hypothetical protein